MRTLLVVEDNPHFVLLKSTRVQCPECGRSVATYLRHQDGTVAALLAQSGSGRREFPQSDPVQEVQGFWRGGSMSFEALARFPECIACGESIDENDATTPYTIVKGEHVHLGCSAVTELSAAYAKEVHDRLTIGRC